MDSDTARDAGDDLVTNAVGVYLDFVTTTAGTCNIDAPINLSASAGPTVDAAATASFCYTVATAIRTRG